MLPNLWFEQESGYIIFCALYLIDIVWTTAVSGSLWLRLSVFFIFILSYFSNINSYAIVLKKERALGVAAEALIPDKKSRSKYMLLLLFAVWAWGFFRSPMLTAYHFDESNKESAYTCVQCEMQYQAKSKNIESDYNQMIKEKIISTIAGLSLGLIIVLSGMASIRSVLFASVLMLVMQYQFMIMSDDNLSSRRAEANTSKEFCENHAVPACPVSQTK